MSIDLHLHSNASDGEHSPRQLVERAAELNVRTIALTDHDTIAGCHEAVVAGLERDVRVVTGCEFSVGVSWGEMHLLAYFLPYDDERLNGFILHQQEMRNTRAAAIVSRLGELGMTLDLEDIVANAEGAAVGRPHIARALVDAGAAKDTNDAFRRFLAAKKPAFIPKKLPNLEEVTSMIRVLGGVSSAAHLRSRATRATLSGLKATGVDAVEVIHPAHVAAHQRKLSLLAVETGLLRTGGSDWHGEESAQDAGAQFGSVSIPEEWFHALDRIREERVAGSSAA